MGSGIVEELLTAELLNSSSITVIAIVSALVQISKRYINPHYAPLLSIAFGLFFSIGYFLSGLDMQGNWFIAIIRGIIVGLAASGLYSNFNITKKRRPNIKGGE